jgi:hypothetical protein
MQNVKTEVKGTKLFIEVDLEAPGEPSASGKSLVVASTRGNQAVVGAEGFTIGLNLYKAAPPKAPKA